MLRLQSRILTVADSYDAMTSERPYKSIMTKEDAAKKLLDNANSLFDAQIVEVFVDEILNRNM